MAEPTSSAAAAGVAGWKLIGGLAAVCAAGAGLAAFIVLCMTHPKDPREWRIALACTLMSSAFGGGAAVRYLEIQGWLNDPFGAMGLVGVLIVCGLPGWAVVRWLFAYINKKQGADLAEIAKELKDLKG